MSEADKEAMKKSKMERKAKREECVKFAFAITSRFLSTRDGSVSLSDLKAICDSFEVDTRAQTRAGMMKKLKEKHPGPLQRI